MIGIIHVLELEVGGREGMHAVTFHRGVSDTPFSLEHFFECSSRRIKIALSDVVRLTILIMFAICMEYVSSPCIQSLRTS